jgi:hypothetical protein
MASWTFFGRVLPERVPLRMDLPKVTYTVAEFGLAYEAHVGIADGQFVADVTVTQGDVDIHTLRNLIGQNIRSTTDLIGYQNGFAYDVEVISAVSIDTGDRCIFGVTIPVLSERRGGVFATAIDAALLLAVGQERGAQIALANFREAIKVAVDSGFFCFRGIEAMMQSMRASDSEKDSVVWDRFRTALVVERAAVDYVQARADTPRHGRPSAITDAERTTALRLTDEMIRRYLEYLVRAKTPLSVGEFPTLSV